MDYNANSNMSVSAKIFLTDSTEDPEASVQRPEGNRGRGSTILDLNKWETRSQPPLLFLSHCVYVLFQEIMTSR